MGKLNLTIDLDKLSQEEKEHFFKLIDKAINYCQDKANGLVSCDGCHNKDCPLIKREISNE